MPRRGGVTERKSDPDPVYGSVVLTKLINGIMKGGKKSVAEKQVYKALEAISKETKEDPLKVFNQAIDNIKPSMEVRSRRVGGAAYQVPMPVRGMRKQSLALRWLIASARARSSSEYHTFADKLSVEIMDAAKGEGGAVKKKTDTEKMAEANRAFAHFRW